MNGFWHNSSARTFKYVFPVLTKFIEAQGFQSVWWEYWKNGCGYKWAIVDCWWIMNMMYLNILWGVPSYQTCSSDVQYNQIYFHLQRSSASWNWHKKYILYHSSVLPLLSVTRFWQTACQLTKYQCIIPMESYPTICTASTECVWSW